MSGDGGRERELVGKVLDGRYRVIARIGEGATSAVFEAEHVRLGRRVAVKVLHPVHAQRREAALRLEHEARIVGSIGHPSICAIHDVGWLEDGSPYLVMERLYGETLAARLRREGVLDWLVAVEIATQVLSALGRAHEMGVVHRDLKPENVFLGEERSGLPVVKLLDFGVSKMARGDMELTQAGMVVGTPYYMAPEQARGQRDLDHRVDLWATGVVLYEALTGRRPFVARNYNALLVQILTSKQRPIGEVRTGVPAALVQAVDRALSKMREDRFQSAQEMRAALNAVRRSEAEVAAERDRPAREVEDETIVLTGSMPDVVLLEAGGGGGAPERGAVEAEDLEQTVVDPPAFLEDSITLVRGG